MRHRRVREPLQRLRVRHVRLYAQHLVPGLTALAPEHLQFGPVPAAHRHQAAFFQVTQRAAPANAGGTACNRNHPSLQFEIHARPP